MKLINTMTSIIAAGALLAVSTGAFAEDGSAESGFGTTGAWTDIAGGTSTSYANLFDVILDEKYSDLWYKYCAAVVGEDGAEAAAQALKGSISSDRYGQEAVDYIAESGAAAFDCWYINGAKQFTFNADNTAAITLDDGSLTLTLTNDDGSITYTKRADAAPDEASGETSGEDSGVKGNPETGAESAAVAVSAALCAGAGLALSRKRTK